MSVLIVFLCVALLVLLIAVVRFNPFVAFLFVAVVAGLALGLDLSLLAASIQKGVGDTLGSIVVVIVCGAMIGKLVAETGAANVIADGTIRLFGKQRTDWALMLTGFIIGIPLFYTVGFVLVVPLIFAVSYRYQLSPVMIGLPMLASLSVTHGFLPPHPSPAALVGQFNADMSRTLFYGILIGLPTVAIAGPLFARTLRGIAVSYKAPTATTGDLESRPSVTNSVFSALLPVLLLALTSLSTRWVMPGSSFEKIIRFVGDSSVVMLIALLITTLSLGVGNGFTMKKIGAWYADAVKDVAMLLLIIGGAGALKQVLTDSGTSNEIAASLSALNIHPLILGWLMAAVIRVSVGSATVAGLTAAGVMLPVLHSQSVDPNLMVLSIGAGSLMFSHVNDAGFWLFKEYFGLSLRDTLRSWSVMESIVAVAGLAGVMIVNAFV